MIPLLLISIGISSSQTIPNQIEAKLGLKAPETLWLRPGAQFAWPLPVTPSTMSYAMWRSPIGQANPLALDDPASVNYEALEGATLAGADFLPISLSSGQTVEASASWVVRSSAQSNRPTPSIIATSKAGLRCEIRLVMDATSFGLGSDIGLKFYDDGSGVKGDFTVTPPKGPVREAKTGVGGVGYFRLDQAGVWAVRFQHNHKSGDRATVRTATLWFENKAWEISK